MSWMERMLYFGLILACYVMGRWQGENREMLNRAIRASEFAVAINENKIDDIQYRLQDDVSVAVYNSYNRFSFGPDLWQKPLPSGQIKVTFNKTLAHAPSKESSPRPPASTSAATSLQPKQAPTLIAPAPETPGMTPPSETPNEEAVKTEPTTQTTSAETPK